jgi:alkylation response protein AidB-like acyl-CoA dehydrogenase
MISSPHLIAGIPMLTGSLDKTLAQLYATGPVDLKRFAQWLRDQPFAFNACDFSQPPDAVLRQAFDTALTIGSYSISLGVAAAMHLYMLGAMATYPLPDSQASLRRAALLAQVQTQRWLVANSGSDMEVRSANAGRTAMSAELMTDGWRVHGHKTFVTMATVADLFVFTATVKASGTPISLLTPLRGVDNIRFEASPLPVFFSETGTCSVVIDDLMLPLSQAISGDADVSFGSAHKFQRMWFCALIPSVYLGAAVAAMSEARNFARHNVVDSKPLAELDGVSMEFGRLVLTLGAAFRGFEAVCRAITAASRAPNAECLDQAADIAAAFKHTAMRAVDEVATNLRRFVGARSMTPGSTLLRFQQESLFGPLHPELDPLIERRLGRKYLLQPT